jgi:glycosyltransferase involved in cell wall biosynthesis
MASVVGQTYPDLEYLVIDGGSRDGTVEIIRKYEPSLAYWHSQPDRGLAHAFNLGLARARGEWILFLNADDYLCHRRVVESMAPHLLAHREAEVVFGRVALALRSETMALESAVMHGRPWQWRQFRFICTIPHLGAFTRRDYFQRVGRFNESLRFAMDYEHYLRAGAGLAARFVPLTVSVMREGGLSLNNVLPTLKEWRWAQTAHRAAPPLLIWGNYLARACCSAIKKAIGRKH